MKRTATSAIAIAALLARLLRRRRRRQQCRAGAGPDRRPAATRLFADPAQVALTDGGRAADHRPGRRRGAGARPAGHDRRRRPGRQRARRLPDDRRQHQPARCPPSPSGINHDLQGRVVPGGAVAGAIAKAITGAYLSSSGNAFSTRTASMIVQEHFPPSAAARGLESGPLFGVQFSQLPCSDLSSRFGAPGAGRLHRPEALAARPLRRSGRLSALQERRRRRRRRRDGRRRLRRRSRNPGHRPATTRRRSRSPRPRASPPPPTSRPTGSASTAPPCATATPPSPTCAPTRPPRPPSRPRPTAMLIAVNGYTAGRRSSPARAYGTEASGIRPPPRAEFANPDAYVLTNGAGANRYPVIAGTDPVGLGADRRRGPRHPRGSVQDHGRRPRPDPPPARQPRPGHDLGGRYRTAGCSASCARPTRRSSAPTCRCRRRGPRPSSRPPTPPPSSAPTPPRSAAPTFAATSRGARLLQRSDRLDRPVRLLRPRPTAMSRGPISRTASSAARPAPSRARSPSSIPSRPGCNRR